MLPKSPEDIQLALIEIFIFKPHFICKQFSGPMGPKPTLEGSVERHNLKLEAADQATEFDKMRARTCCQKNPAIDP